MKIVYFYQYFSTPKGAWGTRVYEFASEWVKKGHEVTVVTSVYAKSDITASKLVEDKIYDGIHVKILNVLIDNKQSKTKRIASFLKYAILSTYYALTLKADIVIASSGPITVGIPGLLAKYIRGRKLVFETRDLWPEGAIELGIIKNKKLQKLAYWFEKTCYKASTLIVSLSPGMQKYIEEKHKHKNVISVTNAANIELFSTEKSVDADVPFKSYSYAIYTGNIGEVNNSYWLFEAAKILKEKGRDDIIILLIGEGQQKEELLCKAKEEQVSNFIIWNLMPKEKLVPIIQHALVSLVPLKGTPVLDTSSPNKFFESLAAGVPIIQNTNGWMKDFLEEHQVGYTINPNDAMALTQKLIELFDHQTIRIEKKQTAIALAKKHFDKNVLAQKMINAIEKIK
ncbi:MAG: glycosyltransferase family 4 protein [Chitinophagaceae bacterium]